MCCVRFKKSGLFNNNHNWMAWIKIIFKVKLICIPQSPLRQSRVSKLYLLSLYSQSITSKPVSCSSLLNSSPGFDECWLGGTNWCRSLNVGYMRLTFWRPDVPGIIFRYSVRTSQKIHFASLKNTNRIIPCKENYRRLLLELYGTHKYSVWTKCRVF